MVVRHRSSPYEERLEILGLHPLDTGRLRGDLIFTYTQFQLGGENELFTLYKDKVSREEHRGYDRKIFKLRPRTKVRQNFSSHRVVSTWNDLPEDIINSQSKLTFKRKLDA